jgi:hypothetical protein
MSDIQDSQTDFQEALDASREQRVQIEEDIKFSDPSDPDQWDAQIKQARLTDPGGVRPCLVHDQTGQYVANVAGQIEKQPPSIHAIPVSGGADKKAAEQIDGRFRHIEHSSRAHQHYARALTSAARTGVGYMVIRPTICDYKMNYQEPRISSEGDPLSVVFDPWSVETDGCDATKGWILTKWDKRIVEKKWGKDQITDFGDTQVSISDERKFVMLGEEWTKTEIKDKFTKYIGADGMEAEGYDDEYDEASKAAGMALQVIEQYDVKRCRVKWRRMSGDRVLESSDYLADYIGIVPVYGFIGFKDGRITYCGIPRRARTAQQAYNYHVSEMLAYIGTAPKAPYLTPVRAIAGLENIWDRSSKESRAYLPFHDIDENGQAIAAPNRAQVSTSLVNHESGAAQALRDIQASIGMYQANLGQKSNETSGIAIQERKEQGEASTAHFPSHMAASLGHVGKIVMQMDIRLHDERRESPIIGIDDSPGKIMIDPEAHQAFERTKQGVVVNPSMGEYAVRVVVGASYSTQRTQTNAAFQEIMRGNKELSPVVAPFWAQTLDFPGSDKFAQAMAAMAPPAVKAILTPEGADNEPDPAELMQKMAEMQEALKEAIQHANDAQEDADAAILDLAEAKRLAAAKEAEVGIKGYQAETDRMKVVGASQEQTVAVVQGLIEQMLSNPDPMPGEQPLQPQMAEAPEAAEGMGMEQPEGMEAPEMEQPQGPSEAEQAILQGQDEIKQGLMMIAELLRKPRVRTPERDKSGFITRVIDAIDEQQAPETLQ